MGHGLLRCFRRGPAAVALQVRVVASPSPKFWCDSMYGVQHYLLSRESVEWERASGFDSHSLIGHERSPSGVGPDLRA